jgi:hypothetical protein
MIKIERGDRVLARSATDQWLRRRALTGVVPGHDFDVVWVCREEDWNAAEQSGNTPEAFPWPAEEVQVERQQEE